MGRVVLGGVAFHMEKTLKLPSSLSLFHELQVQAHSGSEISSHNDGVGVGWGVNSHRLFPAFPEASYLKRKLQISPLFPAQDPRLRWGKTFLRGRILCSFLPAEFHFSTGRTESPILTEEPLDQPRFLDTPQEDERYQY